MKTKLRFFVIVVFILSYTTIGFSNLKAQNAKQSSSPTEQTNDSLKAQVHKLKGEIQEGSYTRIPNRDFENILDNKIQKSLREILNWWLVIVAALVSGLGFLANKYAKAYIQTMVDEKVKQLNLENKEQIKSISTHYFSSVIDSLLDFKIENITKKNNKVDEPVVDDLKSYLDDESITINERKKVYLIDTIMRCYYYSNYPQRIEKMIALIREYEEKLILLETTYVNAAIAFSDMYDRYGTKDFLTSAIENCNKSIKILPDYGLAFAQKLELYIMAMSKSFDENERKQFESELFRVFKDIENNTSVYLCNELVARLEVDKKSYLGPYLEILFRDYADQTQKITDRVPKPAEEETPSI